MQAPCNILFILCDQLRWDYLSCYGSRLHTPNIDQLAARGVRFSRAFCQAPLCGPSRASFYTGRYLSSHGVMANEDCTRLDELMLADYLRPQGYRSALVGKADSRKSRALMARLGIDPQGDFARAAGSGGFEPFELHGGLYPDPILPTEQGYTRYLRACGYPGDNPWQDYANSGVDARGQVHSGWHLRSAPYPSRVDEAHSETAFTTDRAIDFIAQADAQPWCLHLSYIKPHWPLVAPAPYHGLYAREDVPAAVRSEAERAAPHPVYAAFMAQEYSRNYARDEVRETVIPTYMGLIKQIDDHLGRLFEVLRARGLWERTLIVFSSDHGDYLGDHWLGEKDLFHEPSVKIPLLVVDPHPAADASRGQVCEALVEAIDIVPTLLAASGGEPCEERLEGRSLLPLLRASFSSPWREFAISEIDYSDRGARGVLQVPPYHCRAVMLRSQRWKYIDYQGFAEQLFDLDDDPQELCDLGRDPAYGHVRRAFRERLYDWRRALKNRTGMPYARLAEMGPERDETFGILIGRW